MADTFDDKQRAANLRLMQAMMSGGMQRPQPNTPNYSAIPLNPFSVPFNGLKNIPSWAGPDQSKDSATRFTNDPQSFEAPKQPPGLGPVGPLPPFQQPGQQAAEYMPSHLPNPSRQGNYGPAPTAQIPPVQTAAPQGADAAFVPPPGWSPPADYLRTQNDADMAGYGGNMGQGRPVPTPQPYSHLNPTPGLEEIFRQEYAANPGAFGKLFGG